MDMHFDGVIYQSYTQELARRIAHSHPPFLVLDVRDSDAFAAGHVPGALAIEATDLRSGLPAGTTPTTEFFVIGDGPLDSRVRETTLALRSRGALRCVEIAGGMLEWRQSAHPTEVGRSAA